MTGYMFLHLKVTDSVISAWIISTDSNQETTL